MSIAHETRADVYGEALCFRLKAYAELSKPICVQKGEPATHGFVVLSLLPIAATISLIAAIITVLVAIYLVRTRPDSHGDDLRKATSSITNGPVEKWNAFAQEDFNQFLSNFLLPDEIAVLDAMARFALQDGYVEEADESTSTSLQGWRNKHKIASEAGVSHRKVYNRHGIVKRLMALSLVKARDSDSSWANQKHLYRLNRNIEFVRGYMRAVEQRAESGTATEP